MICSDGYVQGGNSHTHAFDLFRKLDLVVTNPFTIIIDDADGVEILDKGNEKKAPKTDDFLISMVYRILEKIKPLEEYTPEEVKKAAEIVFSTEVTELITDEFMKDLKTRESDTIEGLKVDLSQGKSDIEKIWGKGFDLMWFFVNLSNEIAIMYREDIKSSVTDDNRSLLSALFLLHRRGCKVASEIITLLISGYSDGAYARWRTLSLVIG